MTEKSDFFVNENGKEYRLFTLIFAKEIELFPRL